MDGPPEGEDLEAALRRYHDLVRRIARQQVARLPANVELDDLIQAGMIGLTDALVRFDHRHGVRFETYATARIRGAMLDELRAEDFLTRSVRALHRAIDAASVRLEQRLGRAPGDIELALELGISPQELRGHQQRVVGLVRLEDLALGGDDDSPLDILEAEDADPAELLKRQRLREALIAEIALLPERERLVLSLLFEHDMSLREVAEALGGVSQSRVSQIKKRAVRRLRARLRDH